MCIFFNPKFPYAACVPCTDALRVFSNQKASDLAQEATRVQSAAPRRRRSWEDLLGCSSTNCNVVLTDAQGEFTSPCYPLKYPNSQACKWTLQAPAGFIIQLSFLDFDLEEAPGCIYDRVVVNTGTRMFGSAARQPSGLTLNSTGNVMELSFTSDFSVQKRGFSVSFRHVAVALRNQKVTIDGGSGQVTRVVEKISIPALGHLTLCFELERSSQKQNEWIFTYSDSSNGIALSLGSDQNGMKMIVDGVVCPINSVLQNTAFTSSMKPFCVLWTSSNGRVGVYFNGSYRAKTCSGSSGHSVPAGGSFRLGGYHSFSGDIYNLRLWDYAMTVQQLNALSCDTVGNVIDWDNSHWSIPSTLAQTDTTLSCICYPHCNHLTPAAPSSGVSPPSSTPLTTSCDSPGLGCPASSPAASSTDSTNTIHATNANTNAVSWEKTLLITVSSQLGEDPADHPPSWEKTLLITVSSQLGEDPADHPPSWEKTLLITVSSQLGEDTTAAPHLPNEQGEL
ncbi:adhesion G-protein coupled receptor G6-like [Cheilinus undulatus]|uniref:adhesion G-protein coupled receptor G6-like n=1 Tax=Cheilinus undulatus TaxID=241271 RepID=UPI001BD31E63|nr:adhesion G-protein coupled receptor G6-like [Cheilinus undulatus]